MKSKRVRYGVIVLLLAGLFSGCAERVKGPGIQFESDKYDFGSAEEGAIINHEFKFSNNGTESLLLFGVASAGRRTYMREITRQVEPGKSGRISLALNTTGMSGNVSEQFLVVTNVPDGQNIPLTIEGTVKAGAPAAGANTTGGGDNAFFWRIQTGETVVGGSASESKQVKIAFDEAFTGTPKIVATVRNEPGWSGGDTFVVTVRSVSNTHFVANIVRVDKAQPWTQSPLLDWTAWE